MDFETLSRWGNEEIEAVVKILPPDVQRAAERCVISLEEAPGLGVEDDLLEGGELGLFEGVSLLEDPASDQIPKIRIFLRNLWEWVEQDEQDFRDEVGTTLLHELGHYLGWDEADVEQRGLE